MCNNFHGHPSYKSYQELKIYRLIQRSSAGDHLPLEQNSIVNSLSQAPMQELRKTVGELIGNVNMMEEVTQYGLPKKMAQSSHGTLVQCSVLFYNGLERSSKSQCHVPILKPTPTLISSHCMIKCVPSGQTFWYMPCTGRSIGYCLL